MPYGAADQRARVVRQIIDNSPDHLDLPLVTTAIIESNLNPAALGDGGQSGGVFQEYSQGRGAGIPMSGRRDVAAATQRAAREFDAFYGKGARGAALAYRAQRPADQSSYMSRYNAAIGQARQLIAQATGMPAQSAPTGARTSATPAGAQPSSTSYGDSLATAVANRQPGERLIQAVTRGALSALQSNPQNTAQRVSASANAVVNAATALGSKSQNQVVSAALKQQGVPYSWGGGTPSGPGNGFGRGAGITGFDCSSLVQYAWAKAGVSLPRTTYDQIKVGRAVANTSQVQPGDLLFPNTGHVMMAIGNGQAIEAPRTGLKVRIVPISSRPSYIAIRRPG